jgi:hypothetical protein
MNLEHDKSKQKSLTKLDATFQTSSSIVVDTGATVNYIMIDTPCIDVRPTQNPLQVFLADASHITSTHEAELDLPMLPRLARQAHLLPALQPKALLSIGQLCDHGCTAVS